MLRILLWLLLLYIVVKLFRVLRSGTGKQPKPDKTAPPFSDVEDAEFEDLTGKDNSPKPPSPPPSP